MIAPLFALPASDISRSDNTVAGNQRSSASHFDGLDDLKESGGEGVLDLALCLILAVGIVGLLVSVLA